jgi:predicted O-methyltransferase YrrM
MPESSLEFVNFCYRTILGREPDQIGQRAYVQALDEGHVDREGVLLAFLRSDEFNQRQRPAEFVPPGHFFSAVPSEADRERYLGHLPDADSIQAVSTNEQGQLALIEALKPYHDDCPFPDQRSDPYRYWFRNPAFSYSDGIVLYGLMRHFQPRRVVEIGSGFSSCVMLDTREQFLRDMQLCFVEPFPELLVSLLKDGDRESIELIDLPVQQVEMGLFECLDDGDLLFVDSTHVVKLSSDVNHIFFEIIPRLSPGVIVHFHDVFWPFDYPADWIREGRAWNEAYLLRAFLQFNQSFEILFFGSYLHRKHRDKVSAFLPRTQQNTGGSIWLRRTG